MDETIMKRLQDIKGYLGATINNYTGECLIADAQKISGDLEEVSSVFNDVFREANKISKKLKLGPSDILEINTEKGKVLMCCSGENARIHLHMFAIFTPDTNTALGKLALTGALSEAVTKLS